MALSPKPKKGRKSKAGGPARRVLVRELPAADEFEKIAAVEHMQRHGLVELQPAASPSQPAGKQEL